MDINKIKREATNDMEEEWVGPRPEEAVKQPRRKKRKVLEYESLYLSNIPNSDYYEKSYMHRDVVTHVICTKTDFIITASIDGFIKFWKKQTEGIEFVKTFRAHLESIVHICANTTGRQCATISNDKYCKIFDVENFDMINMLKLNFMPVTSEWIHQPSDPEPLLAISEAESQNIHIYSALQSSNVPIQILDSVHTKPVCLIKYNNAYDVVVSTDEIGMIEYWSGRKDEFKTPSCVQFDSKLDTDLFEFVKNKTVPKAISISPNGQLIATLGADKMIRIFKFLTGKLTCVFDETTQEMLSLQQDQKLIGNMEFSKRLAIEKEVDKGGPLTTCSLVFDETSNFLFYPTLLGVKVVNLFTNRLARFIGRPENMRILFLSLFQGTIHKKNQAITVEMKAADNPTLNCAKSDPTLVVTSFKKNRFYIFTKRDHSDPRNAETDRDIFNERPSKEDIIAATDIGEGQRLYQTAILHTSHGDIQLKFFDKECPKTVENFCVHAKNGYYNGHVFHRVIKQFMIQTGDPLGTGVGGESIWGGEFEDEFHPNLKHDRPYTLSMANAGPNSNGSQFFITVVPAPWLDNKHTVFGRVIRGLEVAQTISNVKTNPKTDKPYDDIILISISMK